MHTVLRTDTQRIPAHSGAADTCRACLAEFGGPVEPEHSLLRLDDDTTVAIPAPWLMPPVTRRIDRTPAGVRAWRRLAGSEFVVQLRAGWHRGLAVMGIFGIAYFALLLARGAWVAAELLAEAMTRDDAVLYGCTAIAALSGLALLLLRNPRSFLSRLVDRPADENTTREVQS